MAVTTLAKPRPKCRICGTRSHVLTGHNPRSPRNNTCASCAVTISKLEEWATINNAVAVERMIAALWEVYDQTHQLTLEEQAQT